LRSVAGFASTSWRRPPAFGLRVKTGALNRSAISPNFSFLQPRRLRGVAGSGQVPRRGPAAISL